MQVPQRFAEPLLRPGGSELVLLPELRDHGMYLRRAKTQLAQSRSHPRRNIERARCRRRMRRAAVQRHAEHARQHPKVAGIAGAAQLAPVQRAVMDRAKRDEIVGAVTAAFGTGSSSKQLELRRRSSSSASRNSA